MERTEAAILKCPFCGGPASPDARSCPHCSVDLATARCPKCLALGFQGSRFCAACGEGLAEDPLIDASDAPCPRCATPLRANHDGTTFECATCGGLFVEHAVFARIAAEHDARAKPYAPPPSIPRSVTPEQEHVAYVKCPVCQVVMNRTNFGHRSGVIVDVCRPHGTWFDGGELPRVLLFVENGGLRAERERKERDREAERAKMRAQHVGMAAFEPHVSGSSNESSDSLLEMIWHFFRDGMD